MACRVPEHRPRWYVQVRKANYSTFNGGHRTPSAYSAVRCGECGHCWRTKAKYVDTLPDHSFEDRLHAFIEKGERT